jgi:DNA repair exonuclease SbcCD ATPase subunit
MALFEDAHWKIEAAEDPQLLHEASQVLENALLVMKNGWEHLEFIPRFITETISSDPGILTGEDRHACFERYKELREEVRVKRYNLSHINRSVLGDRIGAAMNCADSSPREASSMLKQIQGDMKETVLTKEDREAVWADMQRAWEMVKGGYSQQREEREQRLEEIKDKQEAFRERLVEEIDELEEKIEEAWSDDFRERAEEKLEHKRQKLEDVERSIRELESKLEKIREYA